MQEKEAIDSLNTLPHSKGSKFQPLIPIPTIPKLQPVVENIPEFSKPHTVIISDRNDSDQLEMYKI